MILGAKGFPRLFLFIEYPTEKGESRARYTITFHSITARISFQDKALIGAPHPRVCRKCLWVDPYVSKEELITFVKSYIADQKNCQKGAVKLKISPWLPFWGEPWQ